MKIMKYLETTEKILIILGIFLFPLIFIPFFENQFETAKLLVLIFVSLVLTIIKLVKLAFKNKLEFNKSYLDFYFIVIILVFLIIGFLPKNNKVESFFIPGTSGFIVLASVFYFLINQFTIKFKGNIKTALLASGFLAATIQIIFFTGILKPQNFDTFGNIFNLMIFLGALLPILIAKIFEKTDIYEKILSGMVIAALLGSITTSLHFVLSDKFKVLDFKTSWSVAANSIGKNPLTGIGPGAYLSAFGQFKPIEYNNTQNWNLIFNQSASTLLTLVTETGFLGMISILLLLLQAVKKLNYKKPIAISLFIIIIGIILLPLSNSFLAILFIFLALNSETTETKLAFFDKKYISLAINTPLLIAIFATAYFYSRVFYAEFLYSQVLGKISNNQGLEAYNLINKVNEINPYFDKYHQLSARINLAIAENLAKKDDTNDSDRENISRLIQQAIREGKAAVSVNPKKSSNWLILSEIYRSIMAFAKGADNFSIQTLNQAIALDPINPLLRIRLGGLYYSLKDYEKAIDVFKIAVLAKPDFPNSHYNLALAYKANKNLDKAKEEINITLSLLGKESLDYEKALAELQDLEELSKPQEAPQPAIKPQLELPREE